jgi:hypothetical protein
MGQQDRERRVNQGIVGRTLRVDQGLNRGSNSRIKTSAHGTLAKVSLEVGGRDECDGEVGLHA